MKKLLAMLMALVLVLSLVACGAAPAAPAATEAPKADAPKTDDVGEPITLIFSIAAVPTDAHGAAQKVFKEKVEELSGGNITVECYDSGTLYCQDTEHDALKNGDVDIIYSSASWLTDGSPWVSMFTAGYVFQSYDHMTKVLNGDIGKEMFRRSLKSRASCLWAHSTWAPVRSPCPSTSTSRPPLTWLASTCVCPTPTHGSSWARQWA